MADLLTLLLLVAAASGGSIIKENEKLKFDVTASRSIEEPPTIEVSFANGVKDDLLLKHYRMNEDSVVACTYLGHLRNSPSSSVAVTGCLNKPGDIMEVTLISKNNINKMFSVDFNGNAEIINNPFEKGALSGALLVDRNFDDQKEDEIIDDDEEESVITAPMVSIPSKLKATIKFGYEDGLKANLGRQDFDDWIAAVFTHTQAHFRHAETLGTTIEFEVQGSAIYNEGVTWTADNNIYDARRATNAANLDGVDTMSWWCNTGGGNTAGIAFVGALCSRWNTNLNEKQWSVAGSGFVLAHELGHNFGMSHDFDKKHGGHSGPCNRQGIMSYGSYSYNQWSTCSRSDWEEHYSGMGWGNGCLEDISDSDGTTTVPPTVCPKRCSTCKGLSETCKQWCSTWNWCGQSWAYQNGGTDCRTCNSDETTTAAPTDAPTTVAPTDPPTTVTPDDDCSDFFLQNTAVGTGRGNGVPKGRINNVQSAEDCRAECAKVASCKFFIWNSPEAQRKKLSCWLKKNDKNPKTNAKQVGRISGPVSC